MSIRSRVKRYTPEWLRRPILHAENRAISLAAAITAVPGAVREWKSDRDAKRAAEAKRLVDQTEHEDRRTKFAMRYFKDSLDHVSEWARSHTEESNFLYAITPDSRLYLSHVLSIIFRVTPETVRSLFEEIEGDQNFRAHIETRLRGLIPELGTIDIGRRLGWYAAARLLKPKIIVETGVDYGLGSCVLCAALLRNASEGHPGQYYGTELRQEAGQLLDAPYSSVGRILYGDSIETLSAMTETIGLFVNDSDHSISYEAREYETIREKLARNSIILGDNSHESTALAAFSETAGRKFVFFRETPKDHWYPGAGIGFSYSEPDAHGV